MSRYQPYPSYKECGVEWLGEVPEHWEVWKIAHAFKTIGSGTTPSTSNQAYFEGDTPWVTTGELRENIITETSKYVSKDALTDYSALTLFPAGSIVMAMYGATIGRLAILGVPATTNQACCVLADSPVIHNDYLYYWLMAYRNEIIQLGSGGGQPNISQDKIINLKVSAPNLTEQTKIIQYLDIQTAKIDTLIAKQERMIELLNEKRSAIISHAVTKGINPNVNMKDSGVEWLGEVPEHWEVKKLKYNLRLQTQKVTIDGHNVIALENIESKSGKYVPTESSYQGEDVEFKAGDILFGKLRPYLAKVYKCNSNGVAFGDLLTYRPVGHFDSSFAFYSLLSEEFIRIVDSSTYGAKMPRASSEFINEMLLATPPLPEQIAIAEHLDIQTSKIDTLIAKSRQAIELMKERRTALISAAVTGKIDVRGNV